MSNEQQGDVRLFQTDNDGDISVSAGVVDMAGGIETAVYLSLFGGNEADSGAERDPSNWWGNIGQRVAHRSETQYLLRALPATGYNLRRIEDAVGRDLRWAVSDGIADTVIVSVTIPAYNRVNIAVQINNESYTFLENWSATA